MDFTELAKKVINMQSFSKFMGIEVISAGVGFVEFSLPVTENFLQHHGFVHGGVISFMLDNALTYAGGSVLGENVLTLEFKVNFIRPAKGTRLVSKGRVIDRTKRFAIVKGEVFSEENGEIKLIAVAQGTITAIGS